MNMHFFKDVHLTSSLLAIVIILLQSCSLAEDSTDRLLRKARDLECLGRLKEAEGVYEQLSCFTFKDEDPMQLVFLMNQARFYLRIKNYSKTILICQKATKACQSSYGANDTLNASILFVLASAYAGLKEYDKASLNYKAIMAFIPKSRCSSNVVELLPLIKLGDIEFSQNNLQQALKLYKEAYAAGGATSTDMISRLLNYRMALCSMALGQNREAELYFKNSLPILSTNAAPKDIIDKYALFLAKCGKPDSASLATKESNIWRAKNKEYVDWQYARCTPSSRCIWMDKYTEQDYYLVDAIKQSLVNK
jgi:tetratricopeptide (TPR) repeat protein